MHPYFFILDELNTIKKYLKNCYSYHIAEALDKEIMTYYDKQKLTRKLLNLVAYINNLNEPEEKDYEEYNKILKEKEVQNELQNNRS